MAQQTAEQREAAERARAQAADAEQAEKDRIAAEEQQRKDAESAAQADPSVQSERVRAPQWQTTTADNGTVVAWIKG